MSKLYKILFDARDLALRAALIVLGAIVTLYVATEFANNLAGKYFLLKSLILVTTSAVVVGLGSTLTRFTATQRGAVWQNGNLILIISFIIISAIVAMVLISARFSLSIAYLSVLIALITMVSSVLSNIAKGYGMTILCDVPVGIIKPIMLLSMLVSINASTLEDVLIVEAISALIALIFASIMSLQVSLKNKGSNGVGSIILKNEKNLILNGIIITLTRNIDILLIGVLVGDAPVALIKLVKLYLFSIANLGNILLQRNIHKMYQLGEKRDFDSLKILVKHYIVESSAWKLVVFSLSIMVIYGSGLRYFEVLQFGVVNWVMVFLVITLTTFVGPSSQILIALKFDRQVFVTRIIFLTVYILMLYGVSLYSETHLIGLVMLSNIGLSFIFHYTLLKSAKINFSLKGLM